MGTAAYEVTRQLGEGGVGRVYEAIHHPSRRVVAIKTLRAEHGSIASQRLLLDEAAAAAQLAHPGIVELIDVGRDERGVMFLVMELVRGSSLEAWSDLFPGLATVLRAACSITDALATAHAQGIVHGDLKPGNVLLTQAGGVKLTDFGIAHVIDPLRKTERRGVQGTPYYMAPEQLIDVDSISPPTDLYALGVMLYELLSGREPYASDGTLVDMLARKLNAVQPFVPRPELVVSPELSRLVMDLLTPDPRMRPRFAARVRDALAVIAARADDIPIDGILVAEASVRTWVETPLVNAPTITSTDSLPPSLGSTRSLPFSLPCIAGPSPEVALHRLRPLPLLGRDSQTEKIEALIHEVVTRGGVRGMVVSGRAGEGKTRLVRHGFSSVERDGTMIGAAASFDETIANAKVGLRAGITRLLGAPQATLAETLAGPWKWLTSASQPDVDFTRMFEWLTPGAQALDQDAIGAVAAMCVLAASRIHPVYLWLDDIAWSHDGAMELMAKLLEDNRARAVVVGTLRSGTAEHPAVRAWLLKVARAGAHFEMLPPLSASDRAALFEAAGLAHDVASDLGAAIDEPTLVLVEAVRAWIDEGLLVASDDGYVLREGTKSDDLVLHARESILGRRISTLLETFGSDAASAERVLCHAALLGLRFDERVLRLCAGEWVDRVLDRALLSGLLRVDGRGAYRFEHRMFLDVVLDRCSARADASEIFCRTGDALTQTNGRRNIDTGLATAMLYRTGGDKASAADCIAQTIRALSRANSFAAADRALDLFAIWNDADALPEMHLHRGLLERVRGIRFYFALDYVTARIHLERARKILASLGAIEHLHSVLFDLSSTHFYQDHFAESERFVTMIAGMVIDPAARARAHHRLSELASMRFHFERAVIHQRLAVEAAAASEDRHYHAIVLATAGELYCALGLIDEAVSAQARVHEISLINDDRQLRSDAERMGACVDVVRGYFAASRAKMMPRLEEAIGRNDPWHITAERALLLMCVAGLNETSALESAAREFISAYAHVPHDETFTWYSIRAAQSFLRAHGHNGLAERVGAPLDARLQHIEKCFEEADPITARDDLTDAVIRSSPVT